MATPLGLLGAPRDIVIGDCLRALLLRGCPAQVAVSSPLSWEYQNIGKRHVVSGTRVADLLLLFRGALISQAFLSRACSPNDRSRWMQSSGLLEMRSHFPPLSRVSIISEGNKSSRSGYSHADPMLSLVKCPSRDLKPNHTLICGHGVHRYIGASTSRSAATAYLPSGWSPTDDAPWAVALVTQTLHSAPEGAFGVAQDCHACAVLPYP